MRTRTDKNREDNIMFLKWLLHHVRIIPLLLFASCNSPVGPLETGELTPLQEGKYWLYQTWNFIVPDTIKVQITRKVEVVIDGQTYLASAFTTIFPDSSRGPVEWLYWNGPDGLFSLGGIAPTDTLLRRTLMFKHPASAGDSWPVVRMYYGHDQKFHFLDTLAFTLLTTNEMLDTPAGRFKCSVYKFTKKAADDVADVWNFYHYYCLGIGRVGYFTRSLFSGRIIDETYLVGPIDK